MEKNRSRLRREIYQEHARYKPGGSLAPFCPWCGEQITSDYAMHEWLVKRNTVRPENQHLIMTPENCIPVHNQDCHIPNGNSREMTWQCLKAASRALSARAIRDWYVSLWQDHGLSVPKGLWIPPKHVRLHQGPELIKVAYYKMGGDPDAEDWQCALHDVRHMAVAAWKGKWRKIYGNEDVKWPKRFSKAGMIDLVDEGHCLNYLAGVIGCKDKVFRKEEWE